MSERKCPHCGEPVAESDFITLCPACRKSLQAAARPSPPAPPEPAEPSAEDLICPSCRAPNAPTSTRCWQCQGPLGVAPNAPSAPSSAQRASLDLGRLFADALGTLGPGEDLDEALLRAAKASSPEHWRDLFTVALQVLAQATGSGESRAAAARRLAGEQMDVEISSSHRESRTPMGQESREGRQVFSSLDDLPPDVRKALEKRLGPLAGQFSGSKTTVTRRVVIEGDDLPPGVKPHVGGVSRKVTVESRRSTPPQAKGCISISTLTAILLGCLGLRR